MRVRLLEVLCRGHKHGGEEQAEVLVVEGLIDVLIPGERGSQTSDSDAFVRRHARGTRQYFAKHVDGYAPYVVHSREREWDASPSRQAINRWKRQSLRTVKLRTRRRGGCGSEAFGGDGQRGPGCVDGAGVEEATDTRSLARDISEPRWGDVS